MQTAPDAASGTPVRFVILTEARSGSNLLVSLLDSHPNISCHSEVFHRRKVSAKAPLDKLSVEWRDAHVEETLQAVFSAPPGQTGIWAAGFKLFYYHNPKLLLRLAREPGVRFIVLRRNDKLAQYASRKIALRTGAWRAEAVEADHAETKVEYRLLEHLCSVVFLESCHFAALRILSYFGSPTILLTYETLTAERDRELTRVQQFLEAPLTALHTQMQRQNMNTALARFSNPDVARRWAPVVQRALGRSFRMSVPTRVAEPSASPRDARARPSCITVEDSASRETALGHKR